MLGCLPDSSTGDTFPCVVMQDADVILLNKDSQPPLCRLLSLDKWKFEQGKAEREAKKKQREARHALLWCRQPIAA